MLPRELLVNRELSWLEFNKRVLMEALRPEVPLLERLKFVAIYFSNLDEFFMVRMGAMTDQSITNPDKLDDKTGWTAAQQISQVLQTLHSQYPLGEEIFDKLKAELCEHGVDFVDCSAPMTKREEEFAENCFSNEIAPFLSPQIVDHNHPFPFLNNKEKYVIAAITTKGGKDKIGVVPLGHLPDYFAVTMDGRTKVLFASDIVERYSSKVFQKKRIAQVLTIRVTRNADLSADDVFVAEGLDFRAVMRDMLKKRRKLFAVRMQVSCKPLKRLGEELCRQLRLSRESVFVQSIPLDFHFGMTLGNALSDDASMKYPEQKPFLPSIYRGKKTMREIAEKECLLVYPYHSYTPFLNLLYEAAEDPDVISIKISLYRLAKHSKVVSALCRAAEKGKDVLVMMELRARFDEQSNLDYSKILEEAGCRMIYGLNDYKIHAKLCLITRQVNGEVQYTTQIGTGNYNEKTAEEYVDLSFLTNDLEIGAEASRFFHLLSIDETVEQTRSLWIAPHCFRTKVIELIEQEIAVQKQGGNGQITIKVNAMNDMEIMEKLVEASQAGVSVMLYVRGICCLRPGVAGFTDHIEIRAIVGRYLEHPRIYIFGEGERQQIFLGSGDLLDRNTRRRVELLVQPKSSQVRGELLHLMDLQRRDTAQTWRMKKDGSYERMHHEKYRSAQEELRCYLEDLSF